MKVYVANFALVDETAKGGRGVRWTAGDGLWANQVDEPIRAAEIAAKQRDLFRATVGFETTRTFDDLEEAHRFFMGHASAIPRRDADGISRPRVSFVFDKEGGGTQAFWLRQGVLEQVRLVKQTGVTLVHEYTFTGGYFSNVSD